LSWKEFEELTPSMFKALMTRRAIRFKHECYAHAITASTVVNVNRTSKDQDIVTPWNFIGGGKKPEDVEVAEVKRWIREYWSRLPLDTSFEKCKEIRARQIDELTRRGQTDATAIFDEVFPHLKD
jgi:hypothetical protein